CCIRYCCAGHVSCKFGKELLVKCIGKVGAFAVVVRQTNIIWVLFVACISIIDISLMHGKGNHHEERNYYNNNTCCIRYCCAGHVSCKFGKELLVKCIGKVGAFAVVVRQTNIIWVLFVACISIIDISLMHGKGN
ncbi:hypothetical protein RYX36_030626, partial [Vicia faba]